MVIFNSKLLNYQRVFSPAVTFETGEDAAVCEQLLLDAPRELFVIAAWPRLARAQEAQASADILATRRTVI